MYVEPIGQEALTEVRAWASGTAFNFEQAESMLPESGFWVPGLAAGWVYLTNSKLAMIEPIVANPGCDKMERSQALDAVVSALCAYARQHGATQVMALTQHPAVAARAEKLGFGRAAQPFYFYLKGLD